MKVLKSSKTRKTGREENDVMQGTSYTTEHDSDREVSERRSGRDLLYHDAITRGVGCGEGGRN